MSAIKVREAVRVGNTALIIKGSIQRRVAAGGGVGCLRIGVGALKIACVPTTGESRLERVVVGIGIIGEYLIAAVSIHTLEVRACGAVCGGVLGDSVFRNSVWSSQDEGI